MKKKILLTTAIIATLSLAACGKDAEQASTTQNTATPIVTVTQKTDPQDNTENNSVPVEPTTTQASVETPAELTWENSGLSYEMIEITNMAATDKETISNSMSATLYLVKVTNNHDDNTYYINNKNYDNIHIYYNDCYLTPGSTYEFGFLSKNDADVFVKNITTIKDTTEYVSIKEPEFNKYYFAPEKECTIVNTGSYDDWNFEGGITLSCDKVAWYLENGMPENTLKDMTGIVPTTSLHFYDANDNLVGVYVFQNSDGFNIYETFDILIIPNIDFTKITAVTFGMW